MKRGSNLRKSEKRKRKEDLDELDFALSVIRIKMYDEAFKREIARHREKGGVFGAI